MSSKPLLMNGSSGNGLAICIPRIGQKRAIKGLRSRTVTTRASAGNNETRCWALVLRLYVIFSSADEKNFPVNNHSLNISARERIAEGHPRLVFRRGRRAVEMPHLPHAIAGAVVALVNLGRADAIRRQRDAGQLDSIGRLEAHDILAGEPRHVAGNFQAKCDRRGHLGNRELALQRLPELGLLAEPVIRMTVEVVLEVSLASENRAHFRNVEIEIRFPPRAMEPQNLFVIILAIHVRSPLGYRLTPL